jgi:DNA-binding XRE family transcriptional regulator
MFPIRFGDIPIRFGDIDIFHGIFYISSQEDTRMIDSNKIRKRRRELDMSQEALGKAVGQDQAYISHIERGRITDITATSLAKIARALHVSMEELMLPDEDEETATAASLVGARQH